MDRQAQKAIMFGLNYGMAGGSSFMRMLIEEQVKMMASMAVAKNSGIGWISLEHTDFSTLELRLLSQMHDETQWQVVDGIEPERYYTANQRGRHWDRKRKETQVKAAPKTAQQLLDEDFANDSPSRLVHQMGEIEDAPHRRTAACKLVKARGKLDARHYYWANNPMWDFHDYKGAY